MPESTLSPHDPKTNVLGEVLEPCSVRPLTGYTRSGACETGPEDHGCHTVWPR